MKFVITWKTRQGGSAAENEATLARMLHVYSKWTPIGDVKFLQFVTRVDGQGGFAVTERDNMADMTLDLTKLTPYLEYTVYPVIDINDQTLARMGEAVSFHQSVK